MGEGTRLCSPLHWGLCRSVLTGQRPWHSALQRLACLHCMPARRPGLGTALCTCCLLHEYLCVCACVCNIFAWRMSCFLICCMDCQLGQV